LKKNSKLFISVFDVDNTILKVNSSFRYYFYLCRKKIFPWRYIINAVFYYLQFLLFMTTPSHLHHKVFNKFLKGRNKKEIFDHAANFFDEVLQNKLFIPIIKCVKEAKKQGHHVVLLSNSPNELICPLAQYLGVDEFYSSIYSSNKLGAMEKIDFLMDGDAKAEYTLSLAKKMNVKKENIFAYTDSYWDLPLMEVVGKPIAVNPDRKLRKECYRKGWNIID
jgi:HAD superfamily hydrolase (TIGR01490 family)